MRVVQVCACNAIGLAANAAAAYYFSQGADVQPLSTQPHLHIYNYTIARVINIPPAARGCCCGRVWPRHFWRERDCSKRVKVMMMTVHCMSSVLSVYN